MNIYIGENIKRLRLSRRITQEQLSVAAGVSCAAVSKWERENTLPDITLLPVLANYFGVSIDELMGYDTAKIEADINRYFEERNRLFRAGKVAEYKKLSEEAYRQYPNDYRVMNCYMWDMVGDYADNDPAVLLANKKELSAICQRILDGCSDIFLRLNAVNMQGKLLHAEGRTDEAIALYEKEIPDWYQTHGQKTEQLFAKNTPEFAHYLRFNMLELGFLAINKKCKELWFCSGLSTEKKGKAAIAFCQSLASLSGMPHFYEVDYYIYCFAKDIAHKLKYLGKYDDETTAELRRIAEEAKKRFVEYSRTDAIIGEYCRAVWK